MDADTEEGKCSLAIYIGGAIYALHTYSKSV